MTTKRFRAVSLGPLFATALTSTVALAQGAPPVQPYPDPNAQPGQQYPQQPGQQYPQQPGQQYPQPPQQYQQQPGYPPQPQPGYPPPPQPYPPQDYQQPQQPPQQYQQQPGYPPPQPPYQQQPGYPPPGYPPPGYPPPYAPPAPLGHHGLLLSAFLGISSFQGTTGEGLSPGLRFGGLIGFYASPVFSLNGELSIDFMNPDSSLGNETAVRAAISFSPLYHLTTNGNLEIVLGPKLGAWSEDYSDTDGNTLGNASGYLVGINAGAYTRVGTALLGGLFSFEDGVWTKTCAAADPFNGNFDQICASVSDAPSDKILAFNLSALF